MVTETLWVSLKDALVLGAPSRAPVTSTRARAALRARLGAVR